MPCYVPFKMKIFILICILNPLFSLATLRKSPLPLTLSTLSYQFLYEEEICEMEDKIILKKSSHSKRHKRDTNFLSFYVRYDHNFHTYKWNKKVISYKVSNYTTQKEISKEFIDEEVEKAFALWAEYADLEFIKSTDFYVDIEIKFCFGEHGDGSPFSGSDLAHSFFPSLYDDIGGDIHLNDNFTWNDGTTLLHTLTHEIGHSLGLSHINVTGAIMSPYQGNAHENVSLSTHDIESIQALYGQKYKKFDIYHHPTPKIEENFTSTYRFTIKLPESTTIKNIKENGDINEVDYEDNKFSSSKEKETLINKTIDKFDFKKESTVNNNTLSDFETEKEETLINDNKTLTDLNVENEENILINNKTSDKINEKENEITLTNKTIDIYNNYTNSSIIDEFINKKFTWIEIKNNEEADKDLLEFEEESGSGDVKFNEIVEEEKNDSFEIETSTKYVENITNTESEITQTTETEDVNLISNHLDDEIDKISESNEFFIDESENEIGNNSLELDSDLDLLSVVKKDINMYILRNYTIYNKSSHLSLDFSQKILFVINIIFIFNSV